MLDRLAPPAALLCRLYALLHADHSQTSSGLYLGMLCALCSSLCLLLQPAELGCQLQNLHKQDARLYVLV